MLEWVYHLLSGVNRSIRGPPYVPYQDEASNLVYNLLFCDDFSVFRPREGHLASPWTVLFAEPADTFALLALAHDPRQEGRIRYLAFRRLRAIGHAVPSRQLLGTVVEVPLEAGLEVVAAYVEGGVRYINQTGRLAILEETAILRPVVRHLFAASNAAIERIVPWDKARRPPPQRGNARLTFLASDGLYLGEGPMARMQSEPLARPVLENAAALVHSIVEVVTQRPA